MVVASYINRREIVKLGKSTPAAVTKKISNLEKEKVRKYK